MTNTYLITYELGFDVTTRSTIEVQADSEEQACEKVLDVRIVKARQIED